MPNFKANDIRLLLKKLSKHHEYPIGNWNFNSDNAKLFKRVIDGVFESNPTLIESGVNHDSFPDATFESLESPPFVVRDEKFSIFISRQTAPEEDEPSYREMSILRQEGRNPTDPRPSRVLSLMLITRDDCVTVSKGNELRNQSNLYWQFRQIWSFLSKYRGKIILAGKDNEK